MSIQFLKQLLDTMMMETSTIMAVFISNQSKELFELKGHVFSRKMGPKSTQTEKWYKRMAAYENGTHET